MSWDTGIIDDFQTSREDTPNGKGLTLKEIIWSNDNILTSALPDHAVLIAEKTQVAVTVVNSLLELYNSGAVKAIANVFSQDASYTSEFVGTNGNHPLATSVCVPIQCQGIDNLTTVMINFHASLPDIVLEATELLLLDEGKTVRVSINFGGTKLFSLRYPSVINGTCPAAIIDEMVPDGSRCEFEGELLLTLDDHDKINSVAVTFTNRVY